MAIALAAALIGVLATLSQRDGLRWSSFSFDNVSVDPVTERLRVLTQYRQMLGAILRDPDAPATSWASQMLDGEKYLTCGFQGGQTNQLISKLNALYLAKLLNRTAILAPFTAVHFKGAYRSIDDMYDLPRLLDSAGTRGISFERLKERGRRNNEHEHIACWAIMDAVRYRYERPPENPAVWRLNALTLEFWAPPTFPSNENGFPDVEVIGDFLGNQTAQNNWLETVRRDLLPQQPRAHNDTSAPRAPTVENVVAGFNPLSDRWPSADAQLQCIDALFHVSDAFGLRYKPV
ncbi:hypothetical protein Rhopal_006340-T1 [Rhodotorula paludigena]|uniref:Uncharacterized protein n=1 Tax=Rhodotorula paludigena TaxID=86838 RepID=A0AAV5GXQ1_9BASI|nr:hypothetical protein Rhopal_006340-T1 [Rhodotorula paludigena]